MSSLTLPSGEVLESIDLLDAAVYDAVVLHTVHPGFDYAFLDDCKRVFDCTYRTPSLLTRPGPRCPDPGSESGSSR